MSGVGPYLVLWQLPDGWEALELAVPDADLAGAVARRMPEASRDLVGTVTAFDRQARRTGALLWATYSHGAGTAADPLELLVLTLTVVGLPGGRSGDDGPRAAVTRNSWSSAAPPGSGTAIRFAVNQTCVVAPAGDALAVVSVATPTPQWVTGGRRMATKVADSIAFVPLRPAERPGRKDGAQPKKTAAAS